MTLTLLMGRPMSFDRGELPPMQGAPPGRPEGGVRSTKAALCSWLEERGIETREMLPLTNQPCYQGRFWPDDFPVAKWVNESGLYIGCHQNLTIEDLDNISAIRMDRRELARVLTVLRQRGIRQ